MKQEEQLGFDPHQMQSTIGVMKITCRRGERPPSDHVNEKQISVKNENNLRI